MEAVVDDYIDPAELTVSFKCRNFPIWFRGILKRGKKISGTGRCIVVAYFVWVDQTVDRLIDWLIGWLCVSLNRRSIEWLIDWLTTWKGVHVFCPPQLHGRHYEEELAKGGQVSYNTAFDYGWCLIRSKKQEDIMKGIELFKRKCDAD